MASSCGSVTFRCAGSVCGNAPRPALPASRAMGILPSCVGCVEARLFVFHLSILQASGRLFTDVLRNRLWIHRSTLLIALRGWVERSVEEDASYGQEDQPQGNGTKHNPNPNRDTITSRQDISNFTCQHQLNSSKHIQTRPALHKLLWA